MKRVIIVPAADVGHLLEVIYREESLVALAGDTTHGRSRAAYDSEEAFLQAVAQGIADRYTFETLADAAAFAETRLKKMMRSAKAIEARCAAIQGKRS